MKKLNERLLREYIASILREDDAGSIAGAAAGMAPYGVHYASKDQLYNTFVGPIFDVFKTGAAETKQLAARGWTAAWVAFETIATSLIPILSSDYQKIFEAEQKNIEAIKNEYKDVYERTDKALQSNDAAILSLLAFPEAAVTKSFITKTPKAAIDLISILSGGKLDDYLTKVKSKVGIKESRFHRSKNFLFEKDEKEGEKNKKDKIIKFLVNALTDERVLDAIKNSPRVQRMKKDAMKISNETINAVLERANALKSAKSFQDLKTKLNLSSIEGLEKLKDIPADERKQRETEVLTNLKKSMLEYYAKSLEKQAENFEGTGLANQYEEAVQKIRSL